MKILIAIVKVVLAIILITFGCNNISEPSNLSVGIGIAAVALGILVIYGPIKSLFK